MTYRLFLACFMLASSLDTDYCLSRCGQPVGVPRWWDLICRYLPNLWELNAKMLWRWIVSIVKLSLYIANILSLPNQSASCTRLVRYQEDVVHMELKTTLSIQSLIDVPCILPWIAHIRSYSCVSLNTAWYHPSCNRFTVWHGHHAAARQTSNRMGVLL